jgi:hypothetical protein
MRRREFITLLGGADLFKRIVCGVPAEFWPQRLFAFVGGMAARGARAAGAKTANHRVSSYCIV